MTRLTGVNHTRFIYSRVGYILALDCLKTTLNKSSVALFHQLFNFLDLKDTTVDFYQQIIPNRSRLVLFTIFLVKFTTFKYNHEMLLFRKRLVKQVLIRNNVELKLCSKIYKYSPSWPILLGGNPLLQRRLIFYLLLSIAGRNSGSAGAISKQPERRCVVD